MEIRSRYSKHQRVSLSEFPVSKTKQSFKEECDINAILRKHHQMGVALPPPQFLPSHSGDFSEVVDYQSAIHAVMAAEAAFASLPSQVRRRFDNNPELYLNFLDDESNLDEAISLGLVQKPVQAAPDASPTPPKEEVK